MRIEKRKKADDETKKQVIRIKMGSLLASNQTSLLKSDGFSADC
jgi:hypothetical protein